MATVKFDRAKIMARIQKKVGEAVVIAALDLQADIKARLNLNSSNIGAGGLPSAPGEPPAKNTGALARSIQAIPASDTTAMKPHWVVGTNIVYGKIQEYGGLIRAKKGKFLAVPMGLDGRRAARSVNGDIRKLDLHVVRQKTGKLFLVKWTGKVMKALFILLKSVYLPPRPYMRPAYAAKKNSIKIRIELAIADALGGGIP